MENIIYFVSSAAIIITLATVYLPMLVDMWLDIAQKIDQYKVERKCPSDKGLDVIGFTHQQTSGDDIDNRKRR